MMRTTQILSTILMAMDLDGRRYASCMARILPDAVANVARMMLDRPWEKEEMQQNGRQGQTEA